MQLVDSKSSLSGADLAKYLFEDTAKQVSVMKDHIKECMRDDREHVNEVINLVVNGFNKKKIRQINGFISSESSRVQH